MVYALKDVSVSMNGREVLQSLSCTLQEGKWISVIGHNGAGKSTFAKLIKGLIPSFSGEYTFNQQPLPRDSKGNMRVVPKIGYVFQNPEQQIFETTVYKELAFAQKIKKGHTGDTKAEIESVMHQMGLSSDLLDASPYQLSGGQKRRVAIASVLIADPELLILDEPTAGLDPLSRIALLEQIKAWQRTKNRTVIFISHQMEDVAEYSDEVMIFNSGRLLVQMNANELFLQHTEFMKQAGLPLPEPVQLLKLIEELSGRIIEPASCREEDIMQQVRSVWQARSIQHDG
ncbi:cobalt transporter ATP-binding subunit [Bacillus sp. FJAT-27264]|uniref:ATP-binding cassette domain-containing protein n=1 Tax=Paenibacillus sp. (strain DSM 101736 / FJAT-27264) TaxID=1850362 RepID=UPI000807A9F0|nr:ATP-binding cassette domain-containing protein [Bacillus sp. FJAT-27264]OBZ16195.1 cobalt transporter ATP-binding subunit [Bacillus sp. FJAT-27264]